MSPSDYAWWYHNLYIFDERLGIDETMEITNYCSGWDEAGKRVTEYRVMLDRIAKALKGNPSAIFTLPDVAGIASDERFMLNGIRRSYLGKASPSELIDTLRLAYAFDLVSKKRPGCGTLATYAKTYFGIDCNAFVGNYYSITPELKPRGYVQRLQPPQDAAKRAAAGFTADVVASLSMLPLRGRESPMDIKTGDVLVTVKNDRSVYPHEHIALVAWANAGANGRGALGIAEWGTAGPLDRHLNDSGEVQWAIGPHRKTWSNYGLALTTTNGWRYVFAPPCPPAPAGWGRCGREDL